MLHIKPVDRGYLQIWCPQGGHNYLIRKDMIITTPELKEALKNYFVEKELVSETGRNSSLFNLPCALCTSHQKAWDIPKGMPRTETATRTTRDTIEGYGEQQPQPPIHPQFFTMPIFPEPTPQPELQERARRTRATNNIINRETIRLRNEVQRARIEEQNNNPNMILGDRDIERL